MALAVTQAEKLLYTAKVHTTGGRGGAARSADGNLEVKLSLPGSGGGGTNPEQLFAGGWAACFGSAMEVAARKMRIALPDDTAIDSEVDLNSNEGGYFLRARLNVSLPGMTRDIAQAVVDAGRAICPYSKAIRNNFEVAIKLV